VSLRADKCHIYTDVDGVFTADPRIVPEARKIHEIDYEEMVELATYGPSDASQGSRDRPAHNMPYWWPAASTRNLGRLSGRDSYEVRNKARGIAHDLNVAKVTILSVPDKPA